MQGKDLAISRQRGLLHLLCQWWQLEKPQNTSGKQGWNENGCVYMRTLHLERANLRLPPK